MMQRTKRLLAVGTVGLLALLGAIAVTSGGEDRADAAPTQSSIKCLDNGGSTTFDLETQAGFIDMPDGNTVYMWSFVPTGGAFQFPGPNLCVEQGVPITVNLTNTLSESTSIVFPGQPGVTATGGVAGLFTNEAEAPGGVNTVSYTFTPTEPGTYLYESGSNTHLQIEMGLFGGFVVRPTMGAQYAYNDAGTEFNTDYEYLLLFHEIDPVIHQIMEVGGDPTGWDPTTRLERYFTINGRSFPDTVAPNDAAWLPSQPYGSLVQVEADLAVPPLVRYANAGLDNHPFHPHGNHLTVVGQDGRGLGGNTVEAFTKTVAAGATYDLLAPWNDVEAWQTTGVTPVEIPGLENVVFKDGYTFYSGAPGLGDTGQFPTGVTTLTECGEYYFPWHSHDLTEVQNFSEGFGGMLTLWRVDPPGGCAP